jgi:acyl-coenzyme A synthetase/AMP-(fatty) acid ligase
MIVERIYAWAQALPSKTAMIHNDIPVSYGAFARSLETTRAVLRREALPVGGTAIVLVSTLMDAWMIVLSLRALGLNTICVQSFAEAEKLAIKDVACIVLSSTELYHYTMGGDALPGVRRIVLTAEIYRDLRGDFVPPLPSDIAGPGGHILYTSGTTGAYKKVLVDTALEERRNESPVLAELFSRDMVHHGVDLGLWTAVGYRFPIRAWHNGGCVILDQRPVRFERFFDHPVTHTCLAAPWLKALVQTHHDIKKNNSRFRISFTSGILSAEVAKLALRNITDAIEIFYGSTELGTVAMRSPLRTMDDFTWLTPVMNRTIQIIDEDGRECPNNVEGELRIRLSDVDSVAYLDDDDANHSAFRGGFFYPGDLAVRRADGRIRILGRSIGTINVKGLKIAALPLEEELRGTLDVDEVCLFSGVNAAGDDELVVAVQTARAIPPQRVVDAVGQAVNFERIRVVIFKEFPRTETGSQKTRRNALRKMVFPPQRGGGRLGG